MSKWHPGDNARADTMMDDVIQLRFWGTRGTIPVTGPEHCRSGGNTACIEMILGKRNLLFDAGSGLRQMGVLRGAQGVSKFDILLTHCHYDHMIGLSAFGPLFLGSSSITFWSGHLWGETSTRDIVGGFLRPPWFPLEACNCNANLHYRDFKAGDVLDLGDGIVAKTAWLHHNGGCIGYRLEWSGKVVALVFDYEHRGAELEAHVLGLMDNANLVVYDSTYTDAEMPRHTGYGHSSWQHGVRLAMAANVGQLALFHHAPWRTDDQLDAIERQARAEFTGAFAARDGQSVEI